MADQGPPRRQGAAGTSTARAGGIKRRLTAAPDRGGCSDTSSHEFKWHQRQPAAKLNPIMEFDHPSDIELASEQVGVRR
jgi:hypothetical protein